MGLSHEHTGLKMLAKIKIYILSRAKLLCTVWDEIPCCVYGWSLMLVLISDVSDNEDDSADEENNKNATNNRNNVAGGIKEQKNIKDCFVSLDKLKVEKGGDIKSMAKTQKVLT